MRNPTKKQVQKVIDNLTKMLPLSKKIDRKNKNFDDYLSVNMYEPSIVDVRKGDKECIKTACGTPMCHGGWYLIASIPKKNSALMSGYKDGAEIMAKHLGFENHMELEDWAGKNPKIWGNSYGANMFSGEEAFTYAGSLTLSKIITHWKRVQRRLPK